MATITTRTDLSDHVADTCANHSEFEQQQIVEILTYRSDRPAWGEDWSNWLETALLDACDEVIAVNAGQPEPPPSDDEDDDESAPVDHAARLARAAAHIGAVDLGDGGWAHHADETSSWWVVTADELEELCDYLDSEDPMIAGDAYSHWCAGCGGEEQPSWWTPDQRTRPVYTYSVYDGNPASCGSAWPTHDSIELEADDDDAARDAVADILEVEAAGLQREDGYEVGDVIHALVWDAQGTIVAQPTYTLKGDDLGDDEP